MNNPNRIKYAIVLSIVIGLLVVWPALQNTVQTACRMEETLQAIAEQQRAVARIDPLRQRTAELKQRVDRDFVTIDAETAQQLRDACIKMMHRYNLTAVQIKLSDPIERPWQKDTPPWQECQIDQEDVQFVLTERVLSLLAEGPPGMVDRLVTELENLHRFAKITRLTIRENARNATLTVDVEITLYDLQMKKKNSSA